MASNASAREVETKLSLGLALWPANLACSVSSRPWRALFSTKPNQSKQIRQRVPEERHHPWFFPCCCAKILWEKQFKRNGLFWLTVPGYSPSCPRSHNSRNFKELITLQPLSRSRGGWMFPSTQLFFYFIQFTSSTREWSHPQVRRVFPYQLT